MGADRNGCAGGESGGDASAAALREELAGFAWEASRFFPQLTLEGLLDRIAHLRPVKSGRRRVFELGGPGAGFYLKLASAPPAQTPLRFLRRFAEWRNLHRLAARGVAACRPAMRGWGGAGRRGAFFLVTEAVAGSPVCAARLPLEPLGRFIAGLNAAGAFAADFHPQNLLVRPDGSLCLIDAQAVFFLPGVARRLGAWQIGRLLAGLPEGSVPLPALDALIAAYNHSASGPSVTAAAAERAARFFRRRRLRSRSRRCCVESRVFTVVRGPEGRGFRRRDFPLGPRALAAAFAAGEPLKEEHVRRSGGICIKSLARRPLHRDRCLAGWRMSHALAVRAVPVARALAYYRVGGRCYLATEYLEGSIPLNEHLSALSGFALRQALRELAAFLRRLHAAGVWQHDLKSANILARGERLFLVDLDGVRLGRLSPRRVLMNLAQLNSSVSGAVGLKERLRFYRYYHGDRQPPRAARRLDYRAIWEISARRNTGASGLELERLRPPPVRAASPGGVPPAARPPEKIERVVFVGKSKRRTGNTRHMLAALRRRVPQVLYLNPARIRRFSFRRDAAPAIAARIEKFRPDLVLSYSKDLPYSVLAGLRGKVTTAVFYPDVRIPLDEQLVRHGQLADYLFITNTRQIPELAARGVRRPLFTLQGCDRDEHRIVPARRRMWAAEAAFIGRPSDAYRIELLREVGRRFRLKTWGGPWRQLGFDCPKESVYPRDYARICHATPVILGCDFSREMDHNTSNRTWITLGCGGFLLTNYQAGLETIFTRGVHLEWYHSVEECLELIAYYLRHESERRRIARQGHAFAHAAHTYDHVMDAVIRRIEAGACESCT